eukprot:CAMPEP_0203892756 /NCGR_PEP_ID=MMETSP0359-20131031/35900_1 /ASSEMBLY_ACC=CAM_ASM_000338 /TAXON_ID=268821 /ORGANISM="Scrippsiella Hangoei, Strain SHTV-5" /LENGTH=207 /DNA_ID=CAMNT_0050814775 /DNA_START=842 /DNA_END=1466 /DNA_ORIENTATION=+
MSAGRSCMRSGPLGCSQVRCAIARHDVEGAKALVMHRFEDVDLATAGPGAIAAVAVHVAWKEPDRRPHVVALGHLGREFEQAVPVRLLTHDAARLQALSTCPLRGHPEHELAVSREDGRSVVGVVGAGVRQILVAVLRDIELDLRAATEIVALLQDEPALQQSTSIVHPGQGAVHGAADAATCQTGIGQIAATERGRNDGERQRAHF